MLEQVSVLRGLLRLVPWSAFDRLVEARGAGGGVRRLSTRSRLVAMLYGQLAGAASLREIETALASHRGRLRHLGARSVARSTPADADARRPAAVSTGPLGAVMARARRGPRRELADVVRLIDSTSLRLAGPGSGWARFSAGVRGAEAHVAFDPDAAQPLHLAVTPARVNDITAAKAMPVEPRGAAHVLGLGHYDHGWWWAKLDAEGCRIVTRLRGDTPPMVRAELPVAAGGAILSDRIGLPPARQAASRRDPFRDPVRGVRVRTGRGGTLRVVTNDLDAPAEEIAALHRRRREVGLFFRRVEQTLRIERLLGRSGNAVRIRLAVALTACLPLRLAHGRGEASGSPLAFRRLVRANLMHRRSMDRLPEPAGPGSDHGTQLALDFA